MITQLKGKELFNVMGIHDTLRGIDDTLSAQLGSKIM